MFLEQAKRIRIGHHDPGNSLIAGGADGLEIDITAGIGGELDGREPRHRGRSGIRAMR
jgi:hypothetical protein